MRKICNPRVLFFFAIILFLFGLFNCGIQVKRKGEKSSDNTGTKPQYKKHNPGWNQVLISNLAYFEYPGSKLEIQSGELKALSDEYRKSAGYPLPDITLQQKGLNNNVGDLPYVRVILQQFTGPDGSFYPHDTKLNNIIDFERQTMLQPYLDLAYESVEYSGYSLIGEPSGDLIYIDRYLCIQIEYVRTSTFDDEGVIVFEYHIQDDNRIINLIMSCLKRDYQNWQEDFNNIIKSFRIDE